MKTKYKTIVISDLHLGSKNSKARQAARFLKNHKCDTLILNGDIIDGWQLKKYGHWKRKHTLFFKIVIRLLEQSKSQVIYVRGNHDDFLDEILPFDLGNFYIVKDYVYESQEKRYYVCHGDVFDRITTYFTFIAKLGDMGYNFLLWINRLYNRYRTRKGLPYYSLSQVIKHKVKQVVSYIDDFELQLTKLAKIKKCDGIICGHIHQPANKIINDIHYLNAGDWVETLCAVCETYEGEWKIVYYEDWKKEHEASVNYQEVLKEN